MATCPWLYYIAGPQFQEDIDPMDMRLDVLMLDGKMSTELWMMIITCTKWEQFCKHELGVCNLLLPWTPVPQVAIYSKKSQFVSACTCYQYCVGRSYYEIKFIWNSHQLGRASIIWFINSCLLTVFQVHTFQKPATWQYFLSRWMLHLFE